MTTLTRLTAIATASADHATIDRDVLGAALLEFAESLQLPSDQATLEAVIDTEIACCLAHGGDADGLWLQLLDQAKADPEGTQQALRTYGLQVSAEPSTLHVMRTARAGVAKLPPINI